MLGSRTGRSPAILPCRQGPWAAGLAILAVGGLAPCLPRSGWREAALPELGRVGMCVLLRDAGPSPADLEAVERCMRLMDALPRVQ